MTIATNNDPTISEEIKGIAHALHVCVTVATDQGLIRRFKPSRGEGGLRGFSFADLMRAIEDTPAQRVAAALIEDPLGESVRRSVRDLGKRLHEIGGMELMGRVLDQVAEMDPANDSRRETIMDRRWDGIGGWAS